MSDEKDKPIFTDRMVSVNPEQTRAELEKLFTPKEMSDRLPELKRPFNETLSVNDRMDVLEFRKKTREEYANVPVDIGLYMGACRKSNLETRRQINERWDAERHAILDDKCIPKLASQLTEAEIADLNRPNRKLRNSTFSGSWYGPLLEDDNLTLKERIDLAVCCYGLYTAGMTEPNEVVDPKAHEMWIIDVGCAMDNLRVPRLRSELTEDQKQKLAELAKPPKFVDYLDLFKPRRDPIDPELYERMRKIAAEHPLKIIPPSNTAAMAAGLQRWRERLGPRGHVSFMDGPMDRPFSDIQLSSISLGNGDTYYDRLLKRAEGGFKRGEFIIDGASIWARPERKSMLGRWFIDEAHHFAGPLEVSFEESYPMRYKRTKRGIEADIPQRPSPKIDYMDSLEMFQAKMANRRRQGKRLGLWLIEQAYDLTRPSRSGFTSFVVPRQTGKRYLSLAFQYAAMGYGDFRNWPLTSCGFFLCAAYDLQLANEWRIYPYSQIDELIQRARDDLFFNVPRVDYDNPNRSNSGRTDRSSRHPHRRT